MKGYLELNLGKFCKSLIIIEKKINKLASNPTAPDRDPDKTGWKIARPIAKTPPRRGFYHLVLRMNRRSIDMWEFVFHLLSQVLCVTNPVAGLAGAGGFVMA